MLEGAQSKSAACTCRCRRCQQLVLETALYNIFSIDWGSAKEPAVLKAAVSVA